MIYGNNVHVSERERTADYVNRPRAARPCSRGEKTDSASSRETAA